MCVSESSEGTLNHILVKFHIMNKFVTSESVINQKHIKHIRTVTLTTMSDFATTSESLKFCACAGPCRATEILALGKQRRLINKKVKY